MFSNRCDAGRQLGERLRHEPLVDPIVVGIWRDGIPVAAEVARVLGAALDLCIVRKLHAPDDPALTIGAVAETGSVYLDDRAIERAGITQLTIEELIDDELVAIERANDLLRVEAGHSPIIERDRDVVLVDDGMSTAATACAAVRAIRKRGAHSITLAVPVASLDAVLAIRPAVQRVISLVTEPVLGSISSRYAHYDSVFDGDIVVLLEDSRGRRAAGTSRDSAHAVRDLRA